MRMLAVIAFILMLVLPARAEETIRLGYINQPLSYSSLAVLKAAYARIGYTVEPVTGPAARLLADTAAGLTDGEVHRIQAIGAKYPSLIKVGVKINTVDGILLSCDRIYDIASVEDLTPYKVAIRIGNRYAEDLTKTLPNIIKTPDAEKMIELLLKKRVDMVLTDPPFAMTQQSLPGRECLHINEPPLVSIPLYHYLHERYAHLVPRITEVLREMVRSGEADNIRRKALEDVLSQQGSPLQ